MKNRSKKIFAFLMILLISVLPLFADGESPGTMRMIGTALKNAFSPMTLLFMFIGCIGGILIGSIPGLTATMGIALLVPFTYGMDIVPAVAMLMGIFCGGMYGGSISAILIHTPGTPAAAATIMDGYPMNQKGEAGRALSIALFASFTGGLLSAIIMTFLSPVIAKVAYAFSPAEFFALAVFGLSVIISISGKSVVKGLIAAIFGLLFATVGMDKVNGSFRFTRAMFLTDGIPFIPCLIGLFALSEVFSSFEKLVTTKVEKKKLDRIIPTASDFKKIMPTSIVGGLIGTFIGAIPGAGGDISAFVSYAIAKNTSKYPEKFGTGVPEGIAAAESANNGCTGGAMIPMLTLGVPGDSNTAVLMGAFVMAGMTPGPMLFVEHLDTVYSVFASMILANFVMLICGLVGIRGFASLIRIDKKMLLPAILVLSLVGSYAINQNIMDVYFTIVMGVVGYLLQRYGFPLSPILLALILGPMAEQNIRRYALIAPNNNIAAIFTRPVSMVFLCLAVFSIVISIISQKRSQKKAEMAEV